MFDTHRRRPRMRTVPDFEEIHYQNLALLYTYLDSSGKIIGHGFSGFDAKKQRKLQRAIKRARALGILPFTTKARI